MKEGLPVELVTQSPWFDRAGDNACMCTDAKSGILYLTKSLDFERMNTLYYIILLPLGIWAPAKKKNNVWVQPLFYFQFYETN